MVLSEEQLQQQRSNISDHVCKSCSSVKLLYLGRNKQLNNVKEYQCPKCGKRYTPKQKTNLEAATTTPKPKVKRERKSKQKLQSNSISNSSYYTQNYSGYLLAQHERERQERRAEFLKENDYYNNIINSELKSYDDKLRKKKDDESNRNRSLIMSGKSRPRSVGHMTKYMRDQF